jgi:hypothetical protein
MSEYHYYLERDSLVNEIANLEKYKTVNLFLSNNDWLFISPIFFQGFELDYFLELSRLPGDHKNEITKQIFRKFYNLNWTATFIDGYCRRCNHIEPFLQSIEHSIILIFQRDYEGGIKTLIPIIEGILRQYLVLEHGKEMQKIKFEHLRKSFLLLKESLLQKSRSWLENYTDANHRQIKFSEDQIIELMELEKLYYDTWFSFITNFIDNSFYLNTATTPLTNELNRHSILHEYGIAVEYNLENYIKIYFTLQFLTWIFLKNEGKSQLNQIGGFHYFEKVMSYKSIIQNSRKLIYDKHLLYRNKKGYNPELLREQFTVKIDTFPRKLIIKYKLFKWFRNKFWRLLGINIGNQND